VRPANVLLVGFMGAGKSMCGRILARRLGRCFVETDDMIAAREGRSIPAIFEAVGEERFRELEGDAVEALATKTDHVIATGGGLPCREGRMDALKSLGTVVWLDGEFRELYERALRGGDRPMLQGRSAAEAEALYQRRTPYYRQAHLTIDTTGLGVDEVVGRLVRALRDGDRHGGAPGASRITGGPG
jgi:shikimate kinase